MAHFGMWGNHGKFRHVREPIGALNLAHPLVTEYEPFKSAEATLVREQNENTCMGKEIYLPTIIGVCVFINSMRLFNSVMF